MTFKTLFPRAMEVAYLDSAAEGLPAPGCAEAFLRYCRDKEQGTPGAVSSIKRRRRRLRWRRSY